MSTERDNNICSLYKQEGLTQVKLAARFGVTEVRIGQILKKAGVTKEDRPKILPNKRGCFVGVWITQPAKDALLREAENEKLSASRFISNLIMVELKKRKVELMARVNSLEIELPLPWEG